MTRDTIFRSPWFVLHYGSEIIRKGCVFPRPARARHTQLFQTLLRHKIHCFQVTGHSWRNRPWIQIDQSLFRFSNGPQKLSLMSSECHSIRYSLHLIFLLTTASLIWSSLLPIPIPILLLLLLSPTDVVVAECISSALASRFKRQCYLSKDDSHMNQLHMPFLKHFENPLATY